MSDRSTERYERGGPEPLDWHAVFRDIRDMAASGMDVGFRYDPSRDRHRHTAASRPQRDFTRPPATT